MNSDIVNDPAGKEEALNETGLLRSRNSPSQLAYYDELAAFFDTADASTLLKLWSFALHSPRQAITDFLVRYELFKLILNVPGNIAEFGVFNGQGLLSFAHFSSILEPYHVQRVLYGFDTFEGIPEITKGDRSSATAENIRQGGFSLTDSFARIKRGVELFDSNRAVGHRPKVKLVKGDVVKTVATFLDENPHALFAMLYLDLDVYEPTKVVLERLLHRVPKGGVVAFDELNTEAYPGETLALLDVLDLQTVELKRFPFCSRISYFIR